MGVNMLFVACVHVAVASVLWCVQFMTHSYTIRFWLNVWMSFAWLLLCGLYVYAHCFSPVIQSLRRPLLARKKYKALSALENEP